MAARRVLLRGRCVRGERRGARGRERGGLPEGVKGRVMLGVWTWVGRGEESSSSEGPSVREGFSERWGGDWPSMADDDEGRSRSGVSEGIRFGS